MKFIIIGAGIGGLSTAIALQKLAYEVVIYEATAELKAIGAGLMLAANAVNAYKFMGVDAQIIAKGSALDIFHIYNDKGKAIATTDNFRISTQYNTVANFAIHRGDLQAALLSCIPNVPIFLGKKCKDFEQKNGKVTLFFEDGSEEEADYVIATDGIHSIFRQKLVPNSQLRFAKQTCWRGVCKELPDRMAKNTGSETWGKHARFGIVPLINEQIYWFAVLHSKELKAERFAKFTKQDLLQTFQGFHTPVLEIIQNTKEKDIIWNDIIDFEPIKQFVFGNIILMGDAAHATTPNMGQGACMAIEDAAMLLSVLKKEKNLSNAFDLWQQKRIPRTTLVVNRSWEIGKMAMWQNDTMIGIRNFLLHQFAGFAQKSSLDFLFAVDFE